MDAIQVPKTKLKLLFNDILRGYSSIVIPGYNLSYIKHFSVFDVADFDDRYESYLNQARDQKCLTLAEKEDYLIKEGLWSHEKNKQIKDLKGFVSGLYITKGKLFREIELNQIKQQISDQEKKIAGLENERVVLLDVTAESYASKRLNEYYIYCSFYKTAEMTEKFFSYDDFNNLDDQELGELVKTYNSVIKLFGEIIIKRIALSGFFLNLFYLCSDSVYEFFGKPAIQLTFYQSELFGFGKYFKNLMSNSQEQPPTEYFDNPEKFIEWYGGKKNVEELAQQGKDADSLVGLSNADREKIGATQPGIFDKLVAEATKAGGSLNQSDIMRIQGIK